VIGGNTMINDFINIIDKMDNKNVLQTLKKEITKKNTNLEQIIENYIDSYRETPYNIKTYSINYGFNRTFTDLCKTIKKINPCSIPENYRKNTINARGKRKNIYEISFGKKNKNFTIKEKFKEKSKQMIIKEAA